MASVERFFLVCMSFPPWLLFKSTPNKNYGCFFNRFTLKYINDLNNFVPNGTVFIVTFFLQY